MLPASARCIAALLRNATAAASCSSTPIAIASPHAAGALRLLTGPAAGASVDSATKTAERSTASGEPAESIGASAAAMTGEPEPENQPSSSPPVSAASAAASAAGTEPARRASILPTWLRSLLPGGKHLREAGRPQPQSTPLDQPGRAGTSGTAAADSPSASAASTPSPASSSAPADGRSKELVQELEKNKDMGMDDYVDLNKQQFLQVEPPRPKLPPVPRTHRDYAKFIDWKRVSYLRVRQHEKIIGVMTQEEKDRVKAEGKAVAKDKRFVQAIAERTGVYIHYEVKDCIEAFVETRDHMRRMYRWVVVLGEPEPKSDAEQRFFLQEMKALEEQEDRLEKLERQDPSNCPILPHLDFMGHDATCSRTGLKFYDCCGRAAGRPAWLIARDRAKETEGLRGRKVPRAEREMRKGLKERSDSMQWDSL